MKNYNKLMLAGALASAITFTAQIRAADFARTPKGESLQPSSATASHDETDLVRSQPLVGNARAAQLHHPVMVAGTASGQIVADRPVYTGRNPFREQPGFEIAPLAAPGKDCGPECQKPCCTKK